MKPDGTKGHMDLILLGMLAKAPGHGYAIMTALKEETGGVLDLPEGSVYPALHKLEDLGWVTSDWRSVAGRRRREYRLSAAGRRALDTQRGEWRRLAEAIDTVMIATRPKAPRRLAGQLAGGTAGGLA